MKYCDCRLSRAPPTRKAIMLWLWMRMMAQITSKEPTRRIRMKRAWWEREIRMLLAMQWVNYLAFMLLSETAIKKPIEPELQLWECTFCYSMIGIIQPDFYIIRYLAFLRFSNPESGKQLIKRRRLTRSFGFCSAERTVKLTMDRNITSRMERTKTMSSWRFSCRIPLVT